MGSDREVQMRINEVHLKNIGPHEEFHVELTSGLIGLLGPNGAGKSTLVNSIYAALTNDFSRFSNVKADIITNNSGKKQSYIRITGSHHNQAFDLTRWLRPNKNELVIGDKVYTKATDVNKAIEEQLGISKLVIDKYVFVNQWEMFQFLSQTDSERAKTFQYLCGTETATKIHKICNDYVARQKGVEIVDNSVELEEAIEATQQQMDYHAGRGRDAKKRILGDEQLADMKKLLKRAVQAEEAAEMIEETEERLGQAKHERKKSRVRRKTVLERVTKDKSELAFFDDEGKDTLLKSREIIENWVEYSGLGSQVTQLEEGLEALQAKYDELVEPTKDALQYVATAHHEEMVRRKGELEFQQKQDAKLLDDINMDDPDEEGERYCPHCQQSVTVDHIMTVQSSYNGRAAELKAIKSELVYSKQFDADLEEFESNSTTLVDAMTKLEANLGEVQTKLKRCPDKAAHNTALAVVRKFEELEDRIVEGEEVIKTLDNKISKYDGRVETIEKQLSSLKDQVQDRPTDEAVVKTSTRVEQHEEMVVAHKVAVECFRDAKKNRGKLRGTLDQLKLRLKEKAKIRNLLETISEAGDVFHWNNLPKTVSQANLELLVDDINDNLQMFNNPFYVEADQDLTFKVYFPGKSPVKAKQLSGGQKVILAIAFRAALDRVFGHDVGMMFLDEPTAGLDADNVEFFHDALQQLAKKVHGNRQLVVITHVQELGGVFDQLVEINKE
jgi:DNA repair exonuclease SbcCD ATPase subunit